jgi:predicted GTPase
MSTTPEFTELADQIVTTFDELQRAIEPLKRTAEELPSDSDACQPILSAVQDLGALAPEVKESVDEVVKGKVWIGVVGHYSHGKSSLLNALLQQPDAPELLPTGDGVVTGLVSRIEFSARRNSHGFRMLRGRESTDLAEDDYRARVAGRSDLTGIYAFDLELATRDLAARELWESMDRKGIALFDTPGLGGPYFNDANQVSQWMREFMLLVVCIRADAISAEVSANLTPFLRDAPKKLLPVFTFWDRWRESPDFAGISDEERARARARELLEARFPLLAEQSHRASFVSARNYRLKTEPSSKDSKLISAGWNIDAFRNTLFQEVDPSILGRGRKLTPFEAHRAGRLHKRLRESLSQIETSKGRVEAVLSKSGSVIPDGGNAEDALEAVKDRLFREYDRLASEIEEAIYPLGQEAGKGLTMLQATEEMKRISAQLGTDFKRQLGRVAKRELDSKFVREIERDLDKSPLSRDKSDRLRDEVRQACRDFVSGTEDIDLSRAFKPPSAVAIITEGFFQTVKMMISIAQNPHAWQTIIIIGAFILLGPILLALSTLVSNVSETAGAVLKVISFVMPFIGLVSFAFLFQSERARAKEAALAAYRKDLRSGNSRDSMRKRIEEAAEDEWANLGDRVRRVIDAMNSGGGDVQSTLRRAQRDLRGIGDKLRELSTLAERLMRAIN